MNLETALYKDYTIHPARPWTGYLIKIEMGHKNPEAIALEKSLPRKISEATPIFTEMVEELQESVNLDQMANPQEVTHDELRLWHWKRILYRMEYAMHLMGLRDESPHNSPALRSTKPQPSA